MTTLHLVYSTLEHALNTFKKSTIVLIKRTHKIKNILSECCLLPSVIDDIIFKYTGSKININTCIDSVRFDNNYKCLICLETITDDYIITIGIRNENDNMTFDADLYGLIGNIGNIYHRGNLFCCVKYFNTFMKKVYNKNNYIDSRSDGFTYFMKKNSIMCFNEKNPYRNGIIVRNYRKFTYMIVTLKCIINGIQKYFKKNNITEYCKKLKQ